MYFLDIFVTLISTFISLLKWPLLFLLGIFVLFYVDCLFWYFIEFIRGKRRKHGVSRQIKPRPALLRIFYDAPRQYVRDMYETDPDFFRPQGLIIFCGRQGAGKTISMMQYAMQLKDTYPLCKCISNTKFALQDAELDHWQKLVNYKNGQKGVIAIMDELQNWFSSATSRNFPPQMLSVITQNRKNRRVILGTAQSFFLLAKPIRSQCTEVRQCITLAGVLTIVSRKEPIVDNEGEVKEMKRRGTYFYVHSPRLRDSYDTWSVVESLSKTGFEQNPFLQAQSGDK